MMLRSGSYAREVFERESAKTGDLIIGQLFLKMEINTVIAGELESPMSQVYRVDATLALQLGT